MRSISERISSDDELYRLLQENWYNNLRVCLPGIIQSFDALSQTVTVQPALREKIKDINGNIIDVQIPLLVDVPIVIPSGGGYYLTMPIAVGDECLVVFSDMCIDAWWASGGIQNQADKRRHDLSDAFAILGVWSQPNKLANYSTTSMQIRNKSGTAYIDFSGNTINLVGTIKKNGVPL